MKNGGIKEKEKGKKQKVEEEDTIERGWKNSSNRRRIKRKKNKRNKNKTK